PTVHLLRHTRPQGRGAALKAGMQYVAEHLRHYTGIVTTAADPRYGASDVVRIMRALHGSPGIVILGAPDFDRQEDAAGPRPRRSLQSRILGLVFQAVTRISLT